MASLFEPPPLLAVLILLAAAGLAFWFGLARPLASARRLGLGASQSDEAAAAWGTPDPPAPEKRAYRFSTIDLDPPEPAPVARAVAAPPRVDQAGVEDAGPSTSPEPAALPRQSGDAGPGAPLQPPAGPELPGPPRQPAEGSIAGIVVRAHHRAAEAERPDAPEKS